MQLEADMSLSPKSVETLIDLVEIKMSSILGIGSSDMKTLAGLEKCLSELKGCAEDDHGPEVFRLRGAI